MMRLVFLLALFSVSINSISIKYRRWCSPWKFCSLTSWNEWTSCDRTCGGGIRTRYRQMCSLPIIDFPQHVAMCQKNFSDFIQVENCSQICSPYGRWSSLTNQCECEDSTIVDSCCTTDRGRWSQWSSWSKCGARCGSYGVRNRTRICQWKSDLIRRDWRNTQCIGDRVQYESCLKECQESEYDDEYFEKMPNNVTVALGKHAQFVCKQKIGKINWLINGQDVTILTIQNPSIKVLSNSTNLFIFPVTNFFPLESRVTCHVTISNGEHIDRHGWLIIDDFDSIKESQCGLLKALESIYYVRFGSSFSIQCQGKKSNSTILWHKNGALIHDDHDEHLQILIDSMLFIDTIDFSHNASFSCTVQTTSKCKQTTYWTLIVFERTKQVTNDFPSNPLNFVGTHGIVLPSSTPWHVTISYRDLTKNFHYETFCSGLLIDEQTILSVSQCFDPSSSLRTFLQQEKLFFDPTKLIVYVGKYDRLSTSFYERQSSVISLINSTNDLILLKVQLLFLSSEARPLPLPEMNDLTSLMENFSLVVTGWGPLSSNGDKPTRLKYVRQRLISCPQSSSPMTLCTTALASKQANVCPGDTGGILFAQTTHRIFAVGLVSQFSKAFCDVRSTQVTTINRLDTISIWLRGNSLL